MKLTTEQKKKIKVILAIYSFAKSQKNKGEKQIEDDIVKVIEEILNDKN